jgi:hypothetical protein
MSGEYIPKEIEITPAMLEAGVKAAWGESAPPSIAYEYVRKVYAAMECARRVSEYPQ